MTAKQPTEPDWPTDPESVTAICREIRASVTEPGWDANGSPVETPEQTAEWEAAAQRARLCLAKPAPWEPGEPYDCGSGL